MVRYRRYRVRAALWNAPRVMLVIYISWLGSVQLNKKTCSSPACPVDGLLQVELKLAVHVHAETKLHSPNLTPGLLTPHSEADRPVMERYLPFYGEISHFCRLGILAPTSVSV